MKRWMVVLTIWLIGLTGYTVSHNYHLWATLESIARYITGN